MTNQYALGYKAGLEAAVKVCRDDAEQCAAAEQWDYEDVALDLAEAIAALPVPSSSSEDCGEVQWRDIPEVRELIDALNAMLTHMGMDEDEWNKPTFDQARAVIAKFKEKQNA